MTRLVSIPLAATTDTLLTALVVEPAPAVAHVDPFAFGAPRLMLAWLNPPNVDDGTKQSRDCLAHPACEARSGRHVTMPGW